MYLLICMGARCARGARSCARSRTGMLNVAYVPIIAERDDGTSELKNVLLLQQLKQWPTKSAVNCSTSDVQHTEWPAAEAAIAAITYSRMRGVCPGTIHNATPDTAYDDAREHYTYIMPTPFHAEIKREQTKFHLTIASLTPLTRQAGGATLRGGGIRLQSMISGSQNRQCAEVASHARYPDSW